ncbi:YraN family protein [Methyloversatilis thermotolerans]|uniref:YraN family protein n=1 Tax=Methyloversatilis thermotolerans TaxID=1346290 RepID=UPI000361D2A5|nr:YraN family protein [Methyloversatilis thermotolerans]
MARHSERPTQAPQAGHTAGQHAGATAEALAARFLQARGLRIIGRNLRWRDGELDLICEHGDTIVFVEVRLRRSSRFGGAAASVDGVKQARLIRAAQRWLAGAGRRAQGRPARFDVIAMSGLHMEDIDWIRDAFAL